MNITYKNNKTAGLSTEKEEYQGPAEVPPHPRFDNPSRHTFAAYAGGDGTLYDVDYVALPATGSGSGTAADADAGDVYDVAALRAHAPATRAELAAAYAAFPDPEQCADYQAYEAALAAWKERTAALLGYVSLPQVMGRAFSRPQVGVGGDDDGSAGGSGSTEALTQDPWDATLVPPEPNPCYYESIDQYELAMQRWHGECCRRLPFLLPHATQLPALRTARIQPAREAYRGAQGAAAGAGADSGGAVAVVERVRPGYRSPYLDAGDAAPPLSLAPPSSDSPPWTVDELRAALDSADTSASTAAAASERLQRALVSIVRRRTAAFVSTGAANARLLVPEGAAARVAATGRAVESRIDPEQARRLADVRDVDADPDARAEQYVRSVQQGLEAWRYARATAPTPAAVAPAPLGMPATAAAAPLPDRAARAQSDAAARLQTRRPFTLADTVAVLRAPLTRDAFVRLCEARLAAPSGDLRTGLDVLVAPLVGAAAWREVLGLWDACRDASARARLAWTVERALRRDPMPLVNDLIACDCEGVDGGGGICNSISSNNGNNGNNGNNSDINEKTRVEDCHLLYVAARCVSHGEPVAPELYPLTAAAFGQADHALRRWERAQAIPFRAACAAMLRAVFAVHYLGFVQRRLGSAALGAAVGAAEAALAARVQRTAAFVGALFHLMARAAVAVSNLALAAALQLLRAPGRALQAHLHADEAGLCAQLGALCAARPRAAQFAAQMAES